MKCKSCKREIPENSIFCNWCGERQIKEKKKKDEIRVPKPRQLKSGMWNIELRAEGMSITEPTAERAVAKAQAIRAGFLEAKKKAGGITLRQAIDAYIDRRSAVLSPPTIRGYQQIRDRRFLAVMDKPISPDTDWQALANAELLSVGVKTLRNALGLVASVYRENGIAMREAALPKRARVRRPWLTPDEIRRFVPLLRGTEVEIAALLALHSLRRSELLALDWENVDLQRRMIHVRGALVPDEKSRYVYKPENKTARSTRDIKIRIPQLYDALQAAAGSGRVVKMHPNSVGDCINNICEANGLPRVGVHGLRHSFASLGYSLGMTELEVMEIGGWADFKTVHDVYLHLAAEDRLHAENKLDAFFSSIEHI